jgi:magnesium chelatase family protein
VLWDDLTQHGESRSSANLRERVLAARELQAQRLGPERLNAQMTPQELERYCGMQPGGKKILSQAMRQYHFSARAYHRIVRVARTIAVLEQSPLLAEAHVAEAILYRCMGQKFWEGH